MENNLKIDMKTIEGKTGVWDITIGLEVHAQVTSDIKLFSKAPTECAFLNSDKDEAENFIRSPNSMVTFFDAAMPGMLPVLNMDVVKQAVKAGLALNGKINLTSVFDRKNYFYPDLPQGYQITQLTKPIIIGGNVMIDTKDGKKNIRIHHIHLEQDAGKSIHDISPQYTYIDLNRAGVALMEIVSEPDMNSAEEASEYIKNLRRTLRCVRSCTGNMDKGEFRCDANVSVKKVGNSELGTRCEIKNLNSIKSIIEAINYEAHRQVELLESGGKVMQETRLFDVITNTTRTMRSKEDANDYRYFPDPDLLPLVLTEEYVEEIRDDLPELPDAKKARYIDDFNLSNYDADILTNDRDTSEYFDDVAKICGASLSVRWITTELFGKLNKENLSIENSPISSGQMVELLRLIQDNTLSERMAKQVFEIMFSTKKGANDIVEDLDLVQITDEDELEKIIDKVLEDNSDKVTQYKQGKDKLYGFFVGETMRLTSGKANPKLVNEILKRKLT